MDDALKAATHPHDFKLLVSSDGQRHTSVESVFREDEHGRGQRRAADHLQPDLRAPVVADRRSSAARRAARAGGSAPRCRAGRCSARHRARQLRGGARLGAGGLRAVVADAARRPARAGVSSSSSAKPLPLEHQRARARAQVGRDRHLDRHRAAAAAAAAQRDPHRHRRARRARAAGACAPTTTSSAKSRVAPRCSRPSRGCAAARGRSASTIDAASAMSLSGGEAVEVGVAERRSACAARARGSACTRSAPPARTSRAAGRAPWTPPAARSGRGPAPRSSSRSSASRESSVDRARRRRAAARRDAQRDRRRAGADAAGDRGERVVGDRRRAAWPPDEVSL